MNRDKKPEAPSSPPEQPLQTPKPGSRPPADPLNTAYKSHSDSSHRQTETTKQTPKSDK